MELDELETLDIPFVFIGNDKDKERYYPAIIGYTEKSLVYSYEKLCQVFMKEDGMSYDDASEHIDYNIVRSIPYWGEHAPILMWDIEQ